MCGRFDQSQTARHYANLMDWTDAVYDSESAPTTNASPGTYRPVFHLQDGERRVDDVFWVCHHPALAPHVKVLTCAECRTCPLWNPASRYLRDVPLS